MDKGFKIYILFLLVMGAVVGIPAMIFSGGKVGLCGIIAFSIGLASGVISNESSQKNSFKKEMPCTYFFVSTLLGYALAGMIMIAFSDMEYEEMESLAKALIIYMVYPVIVFFIEAIVTDKKNQKGESDT